jgi:hypothetical protein
VGAACLIIPWFYSLSPNFQGQTIAAPVKKFSHVSPSILMFKRGRTVWANVLPPSKNSVLTNHRLRITENKATPPLTAMNQLHHSNCLSKKDRIDDRICCLTASGTSWTLSISNVGKFCGQRTDLLYVRVLASSRSSRNETCPIPYACSVVDGIRHEARTRGEGYKPSICARVESIQPESLS